MILTQENYHSPEARALWLSSSAIKTAKRCEEQWYAEHTGVMVVDEDKEAFKLGHYFETMLTGTSDEIALFQSKNPDMFSSTGKTKGQLKATYKSVDECVEAVRRQPYLMEIINRCETQKILTGEIDGFPVRVMMDLLDVDGSIYDLKAMKDFKSIYSEEDGTYVEWWQAWDYAMQMWVYREICAQNGITVPRVGLIAVSKSNADIKAISFSEDTMNAAGADVHYTIGRMKDILNGRSFPIDCGHCSWCVKKRRITEFEEV